MLAMVTTYCANFPTHAPSVEAPAKDTVLVTGTTGSLGCALLSKLLETPEVQHIYALNRIGEDGRDLVQRQQDRLHEWGFNPEIVYDKKITLLEVDMSVTRLGLEDDLYEKVFSSLPCKTTC